MKIIEYRICTTHVDQHGDKMTLQALVDMVTQIKQNYIPFIIEHDPRIPPIGRIKSGEIEFLEDNEYAVKAEIEIFEDGDFLQLYGKNKKMIKEDNIEGIAFIYDRSYDEKDKSILSKLIEITNSKNESFVIKKSIDPISILIISLGIYGIGNFFSGFFNKMGSDAWDLLKDIIKRKQSKNKEYVFQFKVFYNDIRKEKNIDIEINITNAIERDIKNLEKNSEKITKDITNDVNEQTNITKAVYEYSNNKLKLLYFIREDCFPILKLKGKKNDTEKN